MKKQLWMGVAWLATAALAQAQSTDEIMQQGEQWLDAQRQSQAKVDRYDDERRDSEAEYQRLLRQIEGLEAYNQQLRTQISAQETEIARTDASIAKATEVDRQLLPLLLNMVDSYEKLVAFSLPFLPEERAERIRFLNSVVDRADVSAAEKFRQVLDAYMTEMDYGSTIEAYTDTIKTDGGELEVNVLRLGRIAMFYQTADRRYSGRWNPEQQRWEALDAEFRNGIYQAIRVANKVTAPSLLSLPLPPPQSAALSGEQ